MHPNSVNCALFPFTIMLQPKYRNIFVWHLLATFSNSATGIKYNLFLCKYACVYYLVIVLCFLIGSQSVYTSVKCMQKHCRKINFQASEIESWQIQEGKFSCILCRRVFSAESGHPNLVVCRCLQCGGKAGRKETQHSLVRKKKWTIQRSNR